jgi:uncharacterized membrane protein YuzA (DUF378 family)
MRKLYLFIWGINTMALVWLVGSIVLYGSTPGRRAMATELFEIWVGLAAVYAWAMYASRRKAKQKRDAAAR